MSVGTVLHFLIYLQENEAQTHHFSVLNLRKSTASAAVRIQLMFASRYLINLSKGKNGPLFLKFVFFSSSFF